VQPPGKFNTTVLGPTVAVLLPKYPAVTAEQWNITYKVSESAAKEFWVFVVWLLVIIATLALGGKIPETGTGSSTPPPVIVAFTLSING